MFKTINGIQYNVDEILRMTFEEFRSIHADYTEEKAENVWKELGGKVAEKKEESKRKKKTEKNELNEGEEPEKKEES
jgi:hypothetical protein